ncbi:T-cell immunomodulatory protein [Trichoplax sp. H2]|nr:T-cell immunomodulatory protein [Trichoplax sp. H2]|eukprot:RDD47172.1 T-cell immunomodulatory protein [Trichoplax sp. H2]
MVVLCQWQTVIPIIIIAFITMNDILPSHGLYTDVTNSVGLTTQHVQLHAFGDFNSDNSVDLFSLDESNKQLSVLLWDHQALKFINGKAEIEMDSDQYITAVIPGDYDADGNLDVLIAYQSTSSTKNAQGQLPTYMKLYWGNSIKFTEDINFEDKLWDQPLVLDLNGDLIPDIFEANFDSGYRYFWIANDKRNFTKQSMESFTVNNKPALNPIRIPNSNAYVDLNQDHFADLFITTTLPNNDKEFRFEIWQNKDGKFAQDTVLSMPTAKVSVVGQTSFTDFDGDGIQDQVLPVCLDSYCKSSQIYIYSLKKWHLVFDNFVINGKNFGFVSDSYSNNPRKSVPITLRIGDYNLDGFPDAIAVLENKDSGTRNVSTFLFTNVPCFDSKKCHSYSRIFSVNVNSMFTEINDTAVTATFYDLYGDGILDILVNSFSKDTNKFSLHAFKNDFAGDATFLKVTVIGGYCPSAKNSKLCGVNLPSCTLQYQTVQASGEIIRGSVTQLSQTAYTALQLPFIVFGLGQTPNFVDYLSVSLPRNSAQKREHTWSSIIPNSQLIVIPQPPAVPKKWPYKLLLTPSKLVLLTALILIGICFVISAIIGILHWKEKKMDEKEKRENSHRFHFDAM